MRQYLNETGRFDVRITEEFRDAGPDAFRPYDAAVLVYNDKDPKDALSERTRKALVEWVRSGKGLVVYHHSAAGFKEWPEFARLAGGNYYGKAQHSEIHEFTVKLTDREHPITRGLKPTFAQGPDELYANMEMQPPGSYHVLATAYDDHRFYKRGKSKAPLVGPGEDQPLVWTVEAGSGRVLALMIGHSAEATRSAGYRALFTRGTEWAATGEVTLPIPTEMKDSNL
jgi:type 1 glutamine amidotransferase